MLTKDLLAAIQGMLQDDVTKRWGFEELDNWSRGRHVVPVRNVAAKKSRRSFRFGEVDHRIPATLAYSMSTRRDSALEVIKAGSIEHWIAEDVKDLSLIHI